MGDFTLRDRRGAVNARRGLTREDPITFGKHAGTPFGLLPESYLRWLCAECRSHEIRALAAEILGDDQPESVAADVAPSPILAAVAMPLVVFWFQESMRDKFAGNPAALEVVEFAITELKRFTTKFTRKGWTVGDAPAEGGAA